MYSKPIQYMDDVYNSDERKQTLIARNQFVLGKLIDVYKKNDVQAIRDFIGYLNFATKTGMNRDLEELRDDYETIARLMIEEIQATIYKDKTNGLKLVK